MTTEAAERNQVAEQTSSAGQQNKRNEGKTNRFDGEDNQYSNITIRQRNQQDATVKRTAFANSAMKVSEAAIEKGARKG